MRIVLALAFSLAFPIFAAAPIASADPPRVVVLDTIRIVARGPEVFTTISRSRVDHRAEELRADLVREVARAVERPAFD